MKNNIFTFLICCTMLLLGCGENEPENVVSPTLELTEFAFLAADNPSLTLDVPLRIEGDGRISSRLPHNADVEHLVASLKPAELKATVNNRLQQSGSTANDFRQIVTYLVTLEDGSSKSYEVDATNLQDCPL